MSYWEACGPRALSALTRLSPVGAARMLRRVHRARVHMRVRNPHDDDGTFPDVLAVALISLRYDVALYSGVVGNGLLMNAADYRRSLQRHADEGRDWADNLPPDERARVLEERAQLIANPPKPPPPERHYLVREWQHPGSWLVHIAGHVLAVRDGEILSGRIALGRDVSGDEVVWAQQVIPRDNGG